MEIIVSCVCGKCNHNEREKVVIEIDFFEGKMFWVCPSCRYTNILENKKVSSPFPRIGRVR